MSMLMLLLLMLDFCDLENFLSGDSNWPRQPPSNVSSIPPSIQSTQTERDGLAGYFDSFCAHSRFLALSCSYSTSLPSSLCLSLSLFLSFSFLLSLSLSFFSPRLFNLFDQRSTFLFNFLRWWFGARGFCQKFWPQNRFYFEPLIVSNPA